MKWLTAFLALLLFPLAARAACTPGVYGPGGSGDFVVLAAPADTQAPGQRFMLRDGRRGATSDAGSPVTCDRDVASVGGASWSKLPLAERITLFESVGTKLRGKLIEPAGDAKTPLVVMVHGSESTSAVALSLYPYALAAQGIRVFVYDKRGTGGSEGIYTQNFELLADDAAAALGEAQKLAAGHVSRSGYYGGSQGGWVAPLAATRSRADFVAVGFGLVVSPVEEDREQMIDEAKAAHLGPKEMAQIDALSKATAKMAASHFVTGYEDLARVRREIGDAAWAKTIEGEYSGDMLRMSEADLRRIGQARFDNVALIWDYDAVAALKTLKVPLLWVLAGEDRQAPIAGTKPALLGLKAKGQDITVYLFPDTDHGMFEFTTAPDGSRQMTHITDGYWRLLGDWIKGGVGGAYGRGQPLH